MSPGKILDDRHYNGKTIRGRLEAENLIIQFEDALATEDLERITSLLEQVLIAPGYAKHLAPLLLKEAKSQSVKIQLNFQDPGNALAVKHFQKKNELGFPACMLPLESPRDPYLHLGSHPDIVDFLWNKLAAVLPVDCRCIVFGTPGLVSQRSGLLLAQAYGTRYIMRIPDSKISQAATLGMETCMKWSGGMTTDLKDEYGVDWIFGRGWPQEPQWLLEVFESTAGQAPPGNSSF